MINVKVISMMGNEIQFKCDTFDSTSSGYFKYRIGNREGYIPKEGFIVEWDLKKVSI